MNTKFIALFQAPDCASPDGCHDNFFTVGLPRLTSAIAGLNRVLINAVDDDPNRNASETGVSRVDAIVESWFEVTSQGNELIRLPGCIAVYRVAELVEKHEPEETWIPGQAKLFSFIRPLGGMSRDEFRRHWDEHVPIALRVHGACMQYVRHWVESRPKLDSKDPEAWGIGMIEMRDRQSMEQHLFDSPEGRAEVIADTSEFVGARRVMLATELYAEQTRKRKEQQP